MSDMEKLDAGAWFGDEFKGTPVPTLEQALSVMRGKIGGYLVPARLVMNNLRSRGYTELIFEEIEVDTGISPDLFKSTQLTRLRGG